MPATKKTPATKTVTKATGRERLSLHLDQRITVGVNNDYLKIIDAACALKGWGEKDRGMFLRTAALQVARAMLAEEEKRAA